MFTNLIRSSWHSLSHSLSLLWALAPPLCTKLTDFCCFHLLLARRGQHQASRTGLSPPPAHSASAAAQCRRPLSHLLLPVQLLKPAKREREEGTAGGGRVEKNLLKRCAGRPAVARRTHAVADKRGGFYCAICPLKRKMQGCTMTCLSYIHFRG